MGEWTQTLVSQPTHSHSPSPRVCRPCCGARQEPARVRRSQRSQPRLVCRVKLSLLRSANPRTLAACRSLSMAVCGSLRRPGLYASPTRGVGCCSSTKSQLRRRRYRQRFYGWYSSESWATWRCQTRSPSLRPRILRSRPRMGGIFRLPLPIVSVTLIGRSKLTRSPRVWLLGSQLRRRLNCLLVGLTRFLSRLVLSLAFLECARRLSLLRRQTALLPGVRGQAHVLGKWQSV